MTGWHNYQDVMCKLEIVGCHKAYRSEVNKRPVLTRQADMNSDRAIRRDEGERLARVSISFTAAQPELMCMVVYSALLTGVCSPSCPQEYSVPFMETSAKTGVNVELAFTAVAKYETASLYTAQHY